MKLASPFPCFTVIREYQMKETWNLKFCRQTFRVYFLNHSFEMVKKTRTATSTKFLLLPLTPSRFQANHNFTLFLTSSQSENLFRGK